MYLRVIEPILDAKVIEIEIKGGLKNSFKHSVNDILAEFEEMKGPPPTRMVKLKRARKILHLKQIVHSFKNLYAGPGDYLIRFKFRLSKSLPSSLYYKNTKKPEEPKAKVKYYCKGRIVCADPVRDMIYKQVLIIREKPLTLLQDSVINEVQTVNTCCCCCQGETILKAKFNKNVFTPAETAEGEIFMDNSHCNKAVKTVIF